MEFLENINFVNVIIILLAAIAVLYPLMGLKIISQSETMIVERLGKYNRTLTAGINIVWPILERSRTVVYREQRKDYLGNQYVRYSERRRIDLREQVYDFPKQSVITRDNVVTEINALLYFQIVDSKRSVYEIDNLPNAIEKLTWTTLRNVIGELELDETLTSRDTINTKLQSVLDEASNKWGVKVNRVELQEIAPPANIQQAMELQMRAERERRAVILEAEGKKSSDILQSEGKKAAQINQAEAEKQTRILEAQGLAESIILNAKAEAEAIERITKAARESGADPVNYLIATKYIDSLKEMTSGKDNKTVYLPYEATAALGSLGTIKELFADKTGEKVAANPPKAKK